MPPIETKLPLILPQIGSSEMDLFFLEALHTVAAAEM